MIQIDLQAHPSPWNNGAEAVRCEVAVKGRVLCVSRTGESN